MRTAIPYIKKEQKRITRIVTDRFKNYYLTGGTALCLYFNHRFSEDLDFFTQKYRKEDPNKIMEFLTQKTGFSYKLEGEQDEPKMIPMKVYSMELKKGIVLKLDFVQDFMKNTKKIKDGLHSVEDIYLRKIAIAVGGEEKEGITGKLIPTGRQTARDFYDIFYLSHNYKPVSDFFVEYFSKDKAESLIAWYRSFNRMNLKMELIDLVPKVDVQKILRYLDDEILKKLPEKIIP